MLPDSLFRRNLSITEQNIALGSDALTSICSAALCGILRDLCG